MTTLVGIAAEKGIKGIILGSDLSRTTTQWRSEGDVAYRQQTRSEGQKIYVDDKKEVALCMSGLFDQQYVNFLSAILDGKIDIRDKVRTGFFSDLANLNNARWDGKVPNDNAMSGILLATRFDNIPKLYTCWPLGKVEERYLTCIGSGSEYALKNISDQGKLIPGRINLKEGIDIAISALDEASQDIYTGGLDLVVVTPKQIQSFGDQIKDHLRESRKKVLNKVKRNF